MQTAILTLHILVCVFLVVLVLLQAGREGMGVIFGGGSGTVFGSSGAGGILAKLTAFLAVVFVVTSLSYNLLTSSRSDTASSILDVQFEESTSPAPAAPAAPAAAAPAPAEPAAAAPAGEAAAQ